MRIRPRPGLTQFHLAKVGGKTEHHILTLAAENIGEDAKSLLAARNVVKQKRRRILIIFHQRAGQADVLLPAGAFDVAQLTEPFGLGNLATQILISQMMLKIMIALGHGLNSIN